MQRLADFLTLDRWRVYYLAIACVGLLGVGERLVRPWSGNYDFQGEPLCSDFSSFYAAGHLAADAPADIYDRAALAQVHEAVVGPPPGGRNIGSFFLNPPTFLVVLRPFGALPYRAAAIAWLLLSSLLLLASAYALQSRLLPRVSPAKLALIAFLFVPTQVALTLGQNTALTLAVTCAAFLSLRRSQDVWAGICMGLLVIKPQLGLGLALVAIGGRRWRCVASALVTSAALCGVSYILYPEAWPAFFASVTGSSDYVRGLSGDFPVHLSVSVPAAADLLLQPLGRAIAPLLGGAFAIAAAFVVLRRFHRLPWEPGTPHWDLSVGAALGLGWLCSPHLLLYDVALFLVPAAIAALHLHKAGRPFGGALVSATTFLVVLAASLWVQLILGHVGAWQSAEGYPRVLPQLVTVALLAWSIQIWRRAQAPGTLSESRRSASQR